jgi:hypothetical protein
MFTKEPKITKEKKEAAEKQLLFCNRQ